jgi:hypothetical protein
MVLDPPVGGRFSERTVNSFLAGMAVGFVMDKNAR